ncbi:sensor histidine kinase [Halalkalibacillus halophilus]|uniref:sensor histidine kinase n=1 Tax=Halalkalibacillus halophilus TaxID=392827 RepID=UPI00040EA180|nr:HAMP domain-containing sensor histidine kinase [Halalkalibacillus halophilus]
MIRKSLYLRIVITFVTVVLISLVISYVVTSFFFQRESLFEEEMIQVTEGAANVVSLLEENQLDELNDSLTEFDLDFFIAEENDLRAEEISEMAVHQDMIRQVLNAEFNTPVVVSDGTQRIGAVRVERDGTQHVLFVQMNYENQGESIRQVLIMALAIVLIAGSVLIFLASRYVVDPIRKLTEAAKEMARGNFLIRINAKDKEDEVGELIKSFNHMASEVEQIDKMRDDFVSSVSHEFQSPLTSIRGFTKAIKDEVVPLSHQKEYLNIISQETDRLSRLSDHLLQLASLNPEHYELETNRYRLDEQVRRAVLSTEPLWQKKNITVDLQLEPVFINADEDLMNQVWINLLSNAIKCSPENSKITLTIHIGSEQLSASLTDEGPGISEDALPYIFERFYKVDKARTRAEGGNGLGLSIVKQIITIHGYRITVDSEIGKGSTFTVKIPESSRRR